MSTLTSRKTCVWSLCAVAGFVLAAGPARGQAPNPEEEVIERLLLSTAQAFRDKDIPAIHKAFAANCAGPLRIPKLARGILDQMMGAAQTVTADLAIREAHVEPDRALVMANLTLAFELGGGGKEFKGPYLFWLDKGAGGWLISAVEPMATDWSVPEGGSEVQWPDQGMRFAVPKGWGVFPMAGPEVRRGVAFVSPDLSGTISMAAIVLPVGVPLKTVAANHHGIGTIYPGSRFIDETETTLAGLAAVATRMDVLMGPVPSRVDTVMAIRGNHLIVLSRDIMPATAAPRFEAEFAAVRRSLVVATLPADAAGAEAAPAAPSLRAFTYPRLGVGLPAPEGWVMQALDDETARKQGWAFGVHLRPAEGDSTILFGARELPAPMTLNVLQQAEMKNVGMVAEGVTASDVQDLTVSGLPARSWSYTLTIGQARKRREVFITRGNVLFFIVADAIPPSSYDQVRKTVDVILRTLSLAKP